MEFGKKLTEVWQTIRAGRQGMDEGLNTLVSALPDSALRLASIPLRALGAELDMEKGVCSGEWVKNRMNENSRHHNQYDLATETPEMKAARAGTADVTEVVGTVATIVTPVGAARTLAAKTAGVAVTTVAIAGPAVKGFEEGFNAEKAKLAGAPAPVTP